MHPMINNSGLIIPYYSHFERLLSQFIINNFSALFSDRPHVQPKTLDFEEHLASGKQSRLENPPFSSVVLPSKNTNVLTSESGTDPLSQQKITHSDLGKPLMTTKESSNPNSYQAHHVGWEVILRVYCGHS